MRQQGDEVVCLIALWLGMIVLDVCALSPTRNAHRDAQEASEKQHSARVLHRQGGDRVSVPDEGLIVL